MNGMMKWRPSGLAAGSYIRLQDAPTGMTVFAMDGNRRIPATHVPATATEVAHYHIPVDSILSTVGAGVPITVFAYPANGSAFLSASTIASDGVTPLTYGEFRDPNAWSQVQKNVAAGVAIVAIVGIGYALYPKERRPNPSRRNRR